MTTSNPFDHLGRIAWQVLEERRLGGSPGESFCPDAGCGERMTPRQGDGIATHFAHVCAAGEISNCAKAGESFWHTAVKMAGIFGDSAGGWRIEHTYQAAGRTYRADLYRPQPETFVEAVNTLSENYVHKHRDTAGLGHSPLWFFNTAAPFRAAGLEYEPLARFDRGAAYAGRAEASSLFGKTARSIMEAIGSQHCFCHFYGLAFECISVDCHIDAWRCLPLDHPLNQITRCDRGLNHLLINHRVSGQAGSTDLLTIGLGTTWNTQPEYLIEQILHYVPPLARPRYAAASGESAMDDLFARKRESECRWGEHVWTDSGRQSRHLQVWIKTTCRRCGKFYGWRPEDVPGVTQSQRPLAGGSGQPRTEGSRDHRLEALPGDQ